MGESINDFVVHLPDPRLQPFVVEYTGYHVAGLEPGVHAGLPSQSLTLIIAFDDQLDVESVRPSGSERET